MIEGPLAGKAVSCINSFWNVSGHLEIFSFSRLWVFHVGGHTSYVFSIGSIEHIWGCSAFRQISSRFPDAVLVVKAIRGNQQIKDSASDKVVHNLEEQ